MTQLFRLSLSDAFTQKLPADPVLENTRRQVFESCYSWVTPEKPAAPRLIQYSKELVQEMGISDAKATSFLEIVSGAKTIQGSKPYAMCYGGHQFGHWAGQLGDGRAINLGESTIEGKRYALQLKGAGPTPYSRGADGYAVLRSSVREYLCSEAMHHLGVPTTRALSLVISGKKVLRDVLYNGNAQYETGAIVCRVAESFVRFGSLEIFASRNDKSTLKTLVDYLIETHYTHLGTPSKVVYIAFFREVAQRTKSMILHWQRVGFVHGVMNTDNLSILGLTIDYGPYGWLENYDPTWTPNTTDAQHRRYRFENQPDIGRWNITQLANALYPLIGDVGPLQEVLDEYQSGFRSEYQELMLSKIGIFEKKKEDALIWEALEVLLIESELDMTLFFRNLSSSSTWELFWEYLLQGSYLSKEKLHAKKETWKLWFLKYEFRVAQQLLSREARKIKMDAINPKYVLRNYMAHLAIEGIEKNDFYIINELSELLKNPYAEQPEMEHWFAKRPQWADSKIGCSMLSCSS